MMAGWAQSSLVCMDGHGSRGIGHGSWVTWHWSWVMGHVALVMGQPIIARGSPHHLTRELGSV